MLKPFTLHQGQCREETESTHFICYNIMVGILYVLTILFLQKMYPCPYLSDSLKWAAIAVLAPLVYPQRALEQGGHIDQGLVQAQCGQIAASKLGLEWGLKHHFHLKRRTQSLIGTKYPSNSAYVSGLAHAGISPP